MFLKLAYCLLKSRKFQIAQGEVANILHVHNIYLTTVPLNSFLSYRVAPFHCVIWRSNCSYCIYETMTHIVSEIIRSLWMDQTSTHPTKNRGMGLFVNTPCTTKFLLFGGLKLMPHSQCLESFHNQFKLSLDRHLYWVAIAGTIAREY